MLFWEPACCDDMSPRSDRIDRKPSRELSVDRMRIMGAFGFFTKSWIKKKEAKVSVLCITASLCPLLMYFKSIRQIQRSHFYRDLGPGYNLTIYLRKPHELVTETKTAILHMEILINFSYFAQNMLSFSARLTGSILAQITVRLNSPDPCLFAKIKLFGIDDRLSAENG